MQTCVCTYCSDCLCPTCNKWAKIPSWKFLANPTNQSHVMLKNSISSSNSKLVVQNIGAVRKMFLPLLRTDVVETVQQYLRGLQAKAGRETTFVR